MEIYSFFIFLVLYTVFCILLYFVSKKLNVKLSYIYLFFTLHAILCLIGNTYNVLPHFPDANHFHEMAISVIENQFYSGNLGMETSFGALLYIKIIIVPMYLLFGYFAPNVILLNIFFTTISFAILYYLTSELSNNNKIALFFTFMLAILYPSFSLFSLILVREPIVVFGLSLLIYIMYKTSKNGLEFKDIWIILLCLFLVIGLRPQNAPIILGVIFLFFIMSEKITRPRKLLTIIFFIGLIVVLMETPFLRFMNSINPDYLSAYRYSQVIKLDAYLPDIHYQNWIDVFLSVPSLTFYYLLVPFPWVPSSYFNFLFALDSLFCIFLIFLGLLGFWKVKKKEKQFSWLIIYLVLVSVISYSLVEVYYGGAVRHRMQQLFILIPFASIYLSKIIRVKRK
ncbi:MAG TPA: hypothetical protein VNR61_00650 [Niallia sp.]|nr:hypothetical protein [Niallia sp.]